MTRKTQSIYKSDLNLQEAAVLTLSAEERMMIFEALARCAPKEVDIIPIAMLMDRMVKGA